MRIIGPLMAGFFCLPKGTSSSVHLGNLLPIYFPSPLRRLCILLQAAIGEDATSSSILSLSLSLSFSPFLPLSLSKRARLKTLAKLG
jgi:hypothetical protein